jgi:AraC-like DNA-binding protein
MANDKSIVASSCTIPPIASSSYAFDIALYHDAELNGVMEPLPEIRSLIERHAGPGKIASAPTGIPGLMVSAARVATEPSNHIYEPVFGLVAQGAKSIALGDTVFDYGAGRYLVVSVDLPITSHVSVASERAPFLAMGLILRPATIAALLLETAADDRSTVDASGMGVSKAPGDLLDAVVRLLRLLDHPRDVPVLATLIEREILWRLLCGKQGAMLRQIGLADSRLSNISHAIKWIRAHYAKILRIEDLAQMAAMSVSSFHRHFRAVTSLSPIQYQKQIRLQEARARLLAQSADVAAVGFAVGYDSPSQFSREYSRVYGAPPGRDAARLRSAPTLEASEG